MDTVQNKDNAVRQTNDKSSKAFLQVSAGWQRGCWRKMLPGGTAAVLGFYSGETNDGAEASARGGSFHFPPVDG